MGLFGRRSLWQCGGSALCVYVYIQTIVNDGSGFGQNRLHLSWRFTAFDEASLSFPDFSHHLEVQRNQLKFSTSWNISVSEGAGFTCLPVMTPYDQVKKKTTENALTCVSLKKKKKKKGKKER